MSFGTLQYALSPDNILFATHLAFLISIFFTVGLFFRFNSPISMWKKVIHFIGAEILFCGIATLLIIPGYAFFRLFYGGWQVCKLYIFTITVIITVVLILLYGRDNFKNNIAIGSVFILFNQTFYFVTNAVVDRIIKHVYNSCYLNTEMMNIIDSITIPIYSLGLILLIFFLKRFSYKNSKSAPSVCWLSALCLCIPGCIIYLVLYLKYFFDEHFHPIMIIVVLALEIATIVNHYLSYIVASTYEKSLESNAMQIKTNENFQSMQKYTQLNESMKELKHELKNHISLMRTLLAQKDYQKLDAYFDELCGTKFAVVNTVNSNNVIINNILNNFISESELEGVKLDIYVSIKRILTVSDTDLCSLLSNLLSNAYEAAVKSSDPIVSVSIREENDFLFISVKNSINKSVLSDNPELTTSKKDSEIHGIGIRSIRAIAKKYHGSAVFSEQENMFVANVMLVLKKTPARYKGR